VDDEVRLRPVNESDLEQIVRFEWDVDAIGGCDWFGFRMDRVRELERRWREDGLIGTESSHLAVVVGDDTCAGVVDWRPVGRTGNYEIGIALFPAHRGRGVGAEAQRLLVEYLFNTTTVHRIQAGTELDNIAEQKALEKIGFQREGVLRGHHFRAGEWHDGVMYALLRGEQSRSNQAG
jgi:[ribosomal protein S5]-alanine N-acetyltransferase